MDMQTIQQTIFMVPVSGSQRGGRRTPAPQIKEYECIVCEREKNAKTPGNHGDCAPCKFEDKTTPASGKF